MQALNSYLSRLNALTDIDYHRKLQLPLTQSDVNTLVTRMASQISMDTTPDGREFSVDEIRTTALQVGDAYADLEQYCTQHDLSLNDLWS